MGVDLKNKPVRKSCNLCLADTDEGGGGGGSRDNAGGASLVLELGSF